ncbi:MAG: DEAD/DEAH box helicase [Desulfosudaceae bacterium]
MKTAHPHIKERLEGPRRRKTGRPPGKHTGGQVRKKNRPLRLKPGKDPQLKSVFSTIGVPEETAFTPDPFQLEALEAVAHADCIVTAPTGAGKTWIAEQVIERMLAEGKKTWYASPLKALSNSIYEEFSGRFGPENTGILTGDRKENPEAPIIIGTTEILRNQLYDSMHSGEDLDTDFVILDEAHFLGDEDRGVVWEETMIYLPRRIPLLLLSATIGNPDEIAAWLTALRNNTCQVVRETRRMVQLYPLFLHPSGTLFPLVTQNPETGRHRLYKKTLNALQGNRRPQLAPPHRLPPMKDILRILRTYNLLPAIFFMKSRADCDRALELCDDEALKQDPERKALLEARVEEIVRQEPYLADHKQLRFVTERAVAAHHSGHLPLWKKTVEQLMNAGLLDAVFATSTVAAGVNFPARTVAIFNSDRFNGKEFLPLSAIEFHQMTGRAGRRGKDKIGFALVVPGKFMDVKYIAKLVDASPSSINSQIKINFSMTLNLLLGLAPDQVRTLLQNSFALFQYQKKKSGSRQAEEKLWEDFLRHLDFLKASGYADESGRLTPDGEWAAQLRVDHPLMIAESFRLGLLPESEPAQLAAIIASFVNERQTDETVPVLHGTPQQLKTRLFRLQKKLGPFTTRMKKSGFTPTTLYLAPAVSIYKWAAGYPWSAVAAEAGIAEGDLANLVFRTADNLRHIAALRPVFPETALTAMQAVDLIMKEPVV